MEQTTDNIQTALAAGAASVQPVTSHGGIPFVAKNGGAHLIVSAAGLVVDFWPETGLWAVRGTNERRRGVRHLIKRLGGHWPPQGEKP